MSETVAKTPLVSVVMPIFNSANSLPATLKSISDQIYSSWELVAFDDGSTDDSVQIVSDWSKTVSQPVRILQGPNQGPSHARNGAAAAAEGTVLAFLDADDLWHPEKLQAQIDALRQNREWIGVGCDYRIRELDPDRICATVSFDWSPVSIRSWSLMESRGPALCSTLMVFSREFERVGGFDVRLRNLEDLDLVLRIASNDVIGNVEQPLCDYIVSSEQNHHDLSTVQLAIRQLTSPGASLSDSKTQHRLMTNFHLLESRRDWHQRQYLRALTRGSRTFARSPITVTKTIARRMRRDQ